MKIEVPLNKATRLMNSGQVILVSCAHRDKANIITLAWHMPMSHNPPLLGISVAKTHMSAQLIEQQREFAVNIPDEKLLEKIIYCGTHSGREGDKFKAAGLTAVPASRLRDVPLIEECLGHIECRVRDSLEAGDHVVFIGEPVHASAETECFDEAWKVDRVRLVYHLGGRIFTTSAKEIR